MLNEDISLNEAPYAPSCWKFMFVLIPQFRSVSDFSHQSNETVILCWAHLTTDPVCGKKYSAIQDSKWPTVAWRISFWQSTRNVLPVSKFTFICSERFLLFASKQGKQRERAHSLPYDCAIWPICLFGALYKKLYLVSREDYFQAEENCHNGLETW